MRTLCLAVLVLAAPSFAKVVSKKVPYEVDKTKLEGVLIYDDAMTGKPGVVLVPNWMGINDANVKQATEIAARGYVIFVADMYGTSVRPKNGDEAGKAAGVVKGDRALMRKRINKALEVLVAQKVPAMDAKKLGGIGFCFGGTAALELARSGAKVGGVVSFHGGLGSPTPADAKNITAKVLALHGADDPYVPAEEVKGFEDEMKATKIDWQLVKFGNTVHSFTDVDANTPGQAMYNPTSAKRAYALMDSFFAEAFAAP